MKILVLSHMYPSAANAINGIFVHQQIRELVRQGCNIKVVSPVPWSPFPINKLNGKWQAYAENPTEATMDGIDVYYPRYIRFPNSYLSGYSGSLMYMGISKVVDNIHRDFKFDIIHAHAALPDGYAAMILNNKYRKPLVVTIHGQDLQTTLFRNQRCRNAIKKVFKKANSMITVSTKLKVIAEKNIGIFDNVNVINNGIDPNLISSEKSNLDSDYRIILSVSDLIARKAIDLNLKAMSYLVKKHPNLKYLIIGEGLEMNKLKKLTSDLNLNSHVEFLNKLSNENVMEYMMAADIFSLPSWDEGFGIVYIEALAHGKPVIACQGEGIEDVVKQGDTGMLVRPKDVNSLVEALDYLLNHPEEAKAMGERGRRHVLKKFTWEKNVEKTILLYKELLTT